MGVFKNSQPTASTKSATTLIAKGCRFNGQLDSKDSSLHVDGEIEGTVNSNSNLSIGTDGRIVGDIVAASIIVSGTIEGKIHCQHLHIVSDGRVSGEVHSNEFTIETGGQFIGNSKPAESAKPAAKAASNPAPSAASKKTEAENKA